MKILKEGLLWLRALVIELFIFVLTVVLSLLTHFKKLEWKGSKNKRAIFVIHGYFNSSVVWLFHGQRLFKAGLGDVYAVKLGINPFNSIENYARKLQEQIDSTGAEEVILIGHSMGGLIASYYALKMKPKVKILAIVTLASPLQGTYVANIGLGKCAKQMRRGSDLIKELSELIAREKNIKFFHIGERRDVLVVPYTSAFIQNTRLLVKNVGHNAMLYSQKIDKQIITWLSSI